MRFAHLFLGISLATMSAGTMAEEVAPEVAEARAIVKQFFGTLKGELQAAMKAGGPLTAVQVCNVRAPQITESVAADSGWDVARTSLKLRNPGNAPDEWETAVLVSFEERKAEGADVKTMEQVEIVEEDGQRTFRYMKAIPTGDVCLKCHGGSEVAAETEARLLELYPEDKARGYQLGDIRGAFTLSKQL
jgi:hypothetical protein